MKNKIKVIAVIMLIAVLFTACTAAPATVEPTLNPKETVNVIRDPNVTPTPGATSITDIFKKQIVYNYTYKLDYDESEAVEETYEFIFTKLDETNATVSIAEVIDYSKFGLDVKEKDFLVYTVTYALDDATGMYIATGNISSYYVVLEGADVEAYIAVVTETPATSKYDEIWHKTLKGEVLTDADDIQRITFMKDASVKLTFLLNGNKLDVYTYESNYQEWGTSDTMKEVYGIIPQECRVKTYIKYRDGDVQAEDTGNGIVVDKGTPVG